MDIDEILHNHPDLVERKFREYNGLVSRETAAYLVAQEMGLEVEEETTPELTISHLTAGMRRVRVSGKVLESSQVKEYIRKDGSASHTQSAILRDETGKVTLLLWEPSEPGLKAGDLVRVIGGYVREMEGVMELNVSGKGAVEVLGYEPLHLHEVLDGSSHLTIRALILRVNQDRLFESKRGGVFRASSLTLVQDDVRARVIFWEDEAEKPSGMRAFQIIELNELTASVNNSGLLELKATSGTKIVVRDEATPVKLEHITPSEAVHAELDVDLKGQIDSIAHYPEKVAVRLGDHTNTIQINIIHQELFGQLKNATPGKVLLAQGIDLVQGTSGVLEARSTIWSEFNIV